MPSFDNPRCQAVVEVPKTDGSLELTRTCTAVSNGDTFYCEAHQCITDGCHWRRYKDSVFCWLHQNLPAAYCKGNNACSGNALCTPNELTRSQTKTHLEAVANNHGGFKNRMKRFFKRKV